MILVGSFKLTFCHTLPGFWKEFGDWFPEECTFPIKHESHLCLNLPYNLYREYHKDWERWWYSYLGIQEIKQQYIKSRNLI